MSAVLRLATDDYVQNLKKDPFPSSLIIAWPYFSCSTLSFSTQPTGTASGYRSKCSAGNKSIFINARDSMKALDEAFEAVTELICD